jgi:hypothetical protein
VTLTFQSHKLDIGFLKYAYGFYFVLIFKILSATVSYFGYLTVAVNIGALVSAPGDLREIVKGRSSTKVGLFPDSLPTFSLLHTTIAFLHTGQISVGFVTALTNSTQHICHIIRF